MSVPSNTMGASAYRAAERLLAHNRSSLVAGGAVHPRWIDGNRFWYRKNGGGGDELIVVDAARGTCAPAPDGERPAPPADVLAAPAPDGTRSVVRRGYDLWLREHATGLETALTADGSPDLGYGIPPDCLSYRMMLRRYGLEHMPPAVVWSPDSKRVVTHRTDQRGVRIAALVESAPAGGGPPRLHEARYALPGDAELPVAQLLVIDVDRRSTVEADAPPLPMPLYSPITRKRVWWDDTGSAIYYLDQPRDLRALRLKRLDPDTGEVVTVIEESGEPRVDSTQFLLTEPPIMRMLSAGGEVLWYSQRDNWGHLYLYDGVTGDLLSQVTSGEWSVRRILHVDEDERVVYFTASGLVAADPYRRQVCRAQLDGEGFRRLGNDDLDHVVSVAPSGSSYVDSASTTDTPPTTTVRRWDGTVAVELERADITGLLDAGWSAPERFCVKAADGETDVYGLLYRPHAFDPAKTYPVIDHVYPGPHWNRVEPSFDQVPLWEDAEALPALGFVVVALDGRGTPGRSKAFHDQSYGRLADGGGLSDHVAALAELARTRPWMDQTRVGVLGFSAGGFAAVRAMCAHPDVFTVGVAESGTHDQRCYQLGWGETYDGPFDPATYARSSNVEYADRLVGRLLLIHGEMDDNVSPYLTMRLVDRLIASNKDFDLLIVPGAEHMYIGYEHYVRRRKWDFLVRHLAGMEPPAGYRLADTPLDPEPIRDLLGI